MSQQEVVKQLQAQVEELTQTLAKTNRLAQYLETGAQVSRVIASTHNLDKLNKQIVKIIKDGFDFYQVAVFLIDHSAQWAVLHEATGKAGREMKKEGYRLPVDDDQSIIGWVNQNRKPCFFYFHEQERGQNGRHRHYHLTPPPPRTGRRLEMVLPLIAKDRLVGTLHLQSAKGSTFEPDDVTALQTLADQIASAIEKTQLYLEAISERDKNSLLYEISNALSKALDFDAVTATAVGFANRLGATSGEIHLLADTGEVYFKSTYPERNELSDPERQTVVKRILAEGLDAWVLKHEQSALITDTQQDERWLVIEYADQTVSVRSIICSPIRVGRDQLKGAISFVHPEPNHFNEQDLTRLGTLASQIAVALENTMLVNDIQHNLQETHLMLDISRQLAAATNINDVYAALVKSIMAVGVERSVLYMCDELDSGTNSRHGEIVFVSDTRAAASDEGIGDRFRLADYPVLEELTRTQETLVIDHVSGDQRLSEAEQEFLSRFGTQSLALNPLVARGRVIGFISIEYRVPYSFNQRELAMYRTVCNQTTIAIENARQIQRSEAALAETQLLYRAGRVLAGAADIQEVLEEALVEFLYSLGLDQGAITLLTSDRKYGQLMVYVQDSQVQDTEGLKFPVIEGVPYQEILLAGQPFTSYDVANDPRLEEFRSFNVEPPRSLLEAPLIIQGETVGWIGADAVKQHREFTQREIDLARAMADQIAITIQNRRLLEQTERRAEQLRAVAEVGEAVSRMIDLDEVLNKTVDLIRDRFGFYHVSIFLLNEARDWAVVRASTGKVGKIMVERPHRLEVGGKSIVGYVTDQAQPRIALDVGEDAVHFNNPLLPNTRSEMALPLISRGTVIGALDVQSEKANAFSNEDIETLQVMANQLTAALQNAQLFDQTQRRLMEQATLYGIGTKMGATLDLQDATDNLVTETAEALGVAECALTLIEENSLYTISDYTRRDTSHSIKQHRRPHFNFSDSAYLTKVMETKQELRVHLNAPSIFDTNSPEFDYLKTHQGTALLIVPVLLRNDVIAFLEVYDNKPDRRFREDNISLLDSIALQAANTIENIRLFESTQYRSRLLQTAAEVSRTATSILDIHELISATVNLIRDKFDFYYVGLFLVDEEKEWAVLEAGTGEAGRLQVEAEHRLKIGGESMIGWSVKNRQARIALDVGEDAVWFNNPYLPDTHSEMALPLISRDEVIGALTVQSVERGAFSDEDIILLQTMADQVANAIQNARFFTQTQLALSETEKLYQITQELLSARDEEAVYQVAIEAITQSGIDSSAIYMYVDDPDSAEQMIEQKAIWANTGEPIFPNGTRFKAGDLVMEQLVPLHDGLFIEDIDEDPRLTDRVRRSLKLIRIKTLLVLPLSTFQNRLGFLLVAYKAKSKSFTTSQTRLYHTIVQQMVVALENLRLLEASQRRAKREEIIREITGKIRSTTNVDDILKTTVTELSKVLGAANGGVILGLGGSGSNVNPAAGSGQVESKRVKS